MDIIIICRYKNLILAVFKVMPPSFKSLNNDKLFTIMSFILYLNKNRKKGHRILSVQIILNELTKNSINYIAKNICLNIDMIL